MTNRLLLIAGFAVLPALPALSVQTLRLASPHASPKASGARMPQSGRTSTAPTISREASVAERAERSGTATFEDGTSKRFSAVVGFWTPRDKEERLPGEIYCRVRNVDRFYQISALREVSVVAKSRDVTFTPLTGQPETQNCGITLGVYLYLPGSLVAERYNYDIAKLVFDPPVK